MAHSSLLVVCSVLHRLPARHIGHFDQLRLGRLELHSDLVALFHLVFEVLCLRSNPDVLQFAPEHLADLRFIGKIVRYRRKENGPRRYSIGV